MRRARRIGIVGVSAEGAALCYRTICSEGAAPFGAHNHPEVTMHTYPLAEYMRAIEADQWHEVARLLLASANLLVRAGAEILICPDNTVHQARYLMEGPVYPAQLTARNIAFEIPEPFDRERIDAIIFDELTYGHFERRSKQYMLGVIDALRTRGCDGVVLGCTEIPLLIAEAESPLPAIDSTRTLARAALRAAAQPGRS